MSAVFSAGFRFSGLFPFCRQEIQPFLPNHDAETVAQWKSASPSLRRLWVRPPPVSNFQCQWEP